jgi:uncharacterized membrane protein
MAVAANLIAFQIGWFACVLGAAHGRALAGTLAALAIVAAHVLLARRPARELALVLAAALTGALFDSLLAATGWLRYDAGVLVEGAAPYWIVALWALFATTLNASMRGLRGRPFLGALLGMAGGPAAYYGGAQLGALTLVQFVPALLALAIGWAIATPLLLALARRLDPA